MCRTQQIYNKFSDIIQRDDIMMQLIESQFIQALPSSQVVLFGCINYNGKLHLIL
jgi:hypothetical protein